MSSKRMRQVVSVTVGRFNFEPSFAFFGKVNPGYVFDLGNLRGHFLTW